MYIAQLSAANQEIQELGLNGLKKIIQEIPEKDLPRDLHEMSPLEQAEAIRRHIEETAAGIERDIQAL